MFDFSTFQDPSLSPKDLDAKIRQLETFSALAAAQKQTWSLNTSVARAALNELDWSLVSVPGDGNCQPNSLLASLPASSPWLKKLASHEDVRAQVAAFVNATSFDDFQELTQGRYLDWEIRSLWAQQCSIRAS